jgi:hypothetical protein
MTGRGGKILRAPKAFGLALVGVAAAMVALLVAPAFACTGNGGDLYLWPTKGPVGTTVRIEGTRLQPNGVAELSFNGTVVTTVVANAEGTFVTDFVVPSWATIEADKKVAFYQVRAQQLTRLPNGSQTPPATKPFEVTRSTATEPTVPAGGGTPAPTVKPAPVAPGAVGITTQPAGVPVPAPAPTEQAAVPARAGGGRDASVVAVVPGPTAAPVAADAPAEKEDPNKELRSVVGVVSDGDLWAGLDVAQGPSLLDAPAPSPERSLPVGPLVLGSGAAILGLAALALVAGRRRLAHAPKGR